jgi:hypothetical protein
MSIGPLLRGGNADLNLTTAMSAIFFVMWFVWAIQANGFGGFLKELFGPKGETTGVVKILMVVIFFAVGWLEVISILFRPIALSFRLFGNIYAGESILEAMSTMIRGYRRSCPIPFYFPRSTCRICAGARFHAADCGFHNVNCRTPGGTGACALIFRRSRDEITKPTN